MNAIRSTRITSSWALSALCSIMMLANAAPAKAQQVPTANKQPTYQEAIVNAKKARWDNWVSLRDPLLEDKKKLLEQVRKKYGVLIDNAGSDEQAKAYRSQMIVESKKVAAEIKEELDLARDSVDKVFVADVEKICQQHGKPIPRWLNGFRKR